MSVIAEIMAKTTELIAISLKLMSIIPEVMSTTPEINTSNSRTVIFLKISFKNDYLNLIKSFTATQMAANTPNRESIIVKTGVLTPVS